MSHMQSVSTQHTQSHHNNKQATTFHMQQTYKFLDCIKVLWTNLIEWKEIEK